MNSIIQGWGAGLSRVFLAPWSRSRLKKKPGAGAGWEKNQEPEPEPLEKKVRSRKKICRLPSPGIIYD